MAYKCDICKKDYSSYQSLWKHNKIYHINNMIKSNKIKEISINDIKCNQCNKKFSYIDVLDRHIKVECKPDIRHNNIFTFKTDTFGKNKYKNDNGGDIYIIQTEFSLKHYYKIGVTTNLYQRLQQYRCGAVLEPRIHCYFPIKNIKEADKIMKNKLKKYNIKREIYKIENLDEAKKIINGLQEEMKSEKLEVLPEIKQCDVVKCNLCNLIFTSNYELDIHKKSCIQPVYTDLHLANNVCEYCKESFSNSYSRWRHEKTCGKKQDYEKEITQKIMKEFVEKQKEIEVKLKSLKKVIDIQYNDINICTIGDENVNLLTNEERDLIMSQGLNSIISLIDCLNFNDRLPQYHNFYVSAINGKYINTFDNKTKTIIKQSKKDFFNSLLCSHINKLDKINQNNDEFNTVLNKLKGFIFFKDCNKEFINKLNMLSYNKRNIILKTWNNIKHKEVNKIIDHNDIKINGEESDEDSDSVSSKKELNL
jgi:hypothetical protein